MNENEYFFIFWAILSEAKDLLDFTGILRGVYPERSRRAQNDITFSGSGDVEHHPGIQTKAAFTLWHDTEGIKVHLRNLFKIGYQLA